MLLDRGDNRSGDLADLTDGRADALDGGDGILGRLPHRGDLDGDLVGRLGDLVSGAAIPTRDSGLLTRRAGRSLPRRFASDVAARPLRNGQLGPRVPDAGRGAPGSPNPRTLATHGSSPDSASVRALEGPDPDTVRKD
jgi:hypothetical protein